MNMKVFTLSILAAGVLAVQATTSQAVSVTFAEYTQDPSRISVANRNPYLYTAQSPLTGPSTFKPIAAFAANGIPITFQYDNFLAGLQAGYSPIIGNGYKANFQFFGSASSGEVPTLSSQNPFDTFTFTITAITDATNTAAGISGKVLLSGTAGTGSADAGILKAERNSLSGGFDASNPGGLGPVAPNFVTFDSDVITIPLNLTDQNLSLAFTSITTFAGANVTGTPTISGARYQNYVLGAYLRSFRASGGGNFAANFVPAVPEPGTVALCGAVLVSGGVFGIRRRRRA